MTMRVIELFLFPSRLITNLRVPILTATIFVPVRKQTEGQKYCPLGLSLGAFPWSVSTGQGPEALFP